VQQDVEAVRKEIDFLTHIKHPNIIRLYEVYENSSEIFLVLELYARPQPLMCSAQCSSELVLIPSLV
jgi:serine/threonine protein kinase